MNTLEMIAYTARVSNPSNQHNNETAEKLVSYCAKNQYWSVFEMVDATLEIITTRDIGRQILRQNFLYRSFSFWEFSQRYADSTKSLDFLVRAARLQARAVLPESMTMSKMYMKGSLRSWIHYIQLSSGNGTGKEHREIALMAANELENIFPYINDCVYKETKWNI